MVVAVGIEYLLGLDLEYYVSENLRFVGFPIPMVAFHMENGRWVDYVPPDLILHTALLTNLVVPAAVAVLPLLLWLRFHPSKHGSSD